MLVLFLQRTDKTQGLSIVTVQLDSQTNIERDRCSCSRSSSSCKLSCIERTGGALLAQRYTADRSLDEWNLANLGIPQRRELPDSAWANLKRITIKFKTKEGMR